MWSKFVPGEASDKKINQTIRDIIKHDYNQEGSITNSNLTIN